MLLDLKSDFSHSSTAPGAAWMSFYRQDALPLTVRHEMGP
jgi:hypothetical protein